MNTQYTLYVPPTHELQLVCPLHDVCGHMAGF